MSNLAPGFLIAAPTMMDPRFEKAVILLAESTDEGALGFIINRRSPYTFADIADDIGLELSDERQRKVVHFGGPVSQERGWVLFRDPGSHTDEESIIGIGDDLRVSATLETLDRFIADDNESPFRLMLGYAGWGPSQLESEIEEGSWLPLDLDPDLVFTVPEDDLWDEAIKRMGLTPGAFFMMGGGAKA